MPSPSEVPGGKAAGKVTSFACFVKRISAGAVAGKGGIMETVGGGNAGKRLFRLCAVPHPDPILTAGTRGKATGQVRQEEPKRLRSAGRDRRR